MPKCQAKVCSEILIGWCITAIFLNCAWAQTPDSYVHIYSELDRRLESGEGRVAARLRPKVDPNTVNARPEPKSTTFKGKTLHQWRVDLEISFEQAAQRIEETNQKRLEALRNEVQETCGTDRFVPAAIGMAEKTFLQCSLEGRMGGITNIVSATDGNVSARLYALTSGTTQKIYVVDGVVRTMLPPVVRAPLPALHNVTQYPERYSNPQIVALPGGEYFLFGRDEGEDWGLPAAQAVQKLADTTDRIHSSEEPPPLQWDVDRNGWVRLPRSPKCSGYWYLNTLSVLPDSRVLVAGGLCDIARAVNEPGIFEPQTTTSIWNSKTMAWEAGPILRNARIYHTATVMPDGNVMLLGGLGDPLHTSPQEPLASGEIFSGAVNVPMDSMAIARAKHSATLLNDGSIVVIGGQGRNTTTLSTVEMWSSLRRTWELRSPMLEPRYAHTANLMTDGRILVAGGIGAQGEALNTTEFFDPVRNTWAPGPPLPQHLQSHTGTVLADGTVVLAGGLIEATGDHQPWLHVLYPGQSRWTKTGTRLTSMTSRGLSHRTLIVPSGRGNALLFANSGILYWRNPVALSNAASVKDAPITAETTPDNTPEMSALLLTLQDVPVPTVTPNASLVPLDKPSQKSRWSRFIDALRDSPITFPLVGVLLALLLIVGLKRRRNKQSTKAPTASSREFKWFMRLVLYGLLLVFALPNLLAYLALTSRDMDDECGANPGACLDKERHLLKQDSRVPDQSKSARPRIPCAFVGVWESKFKDHPTRFELRADGTYRMDSATPSTIQNDAGHWVIQGKFMVWRSTLHRSIDADINRIVSNDGKHFELVENNGIHSHFDRVENLPDGSCERAK